MIIGICSDLLYKMSGSKPLDCVLFQGPGGFREFREAGRNHFHLSWYLSDAVVTSYGKKYKGLHPWLTILFFLASGLVI